MQTVVAPDGQRVAVYDSNNPTLAVPPSLINSYSILTIPAYFRAMRFLSENLASFPRRVQLKGMRIPEAEEHPLEDLLNDAPNLYQGVVPFWRTMFFQAVHTFNGFARVERQGAKPVALHNMGQGDVTPFRWNDGKGLRQYYYEISTKNIYFGEDVIHFQGLGIDGQVGIDPIRLHTDTYQRAKTIDKYTTRFLMKGTVIRGSVQVPGSMDARQFEEMRQRLRSNFRGSEAEDDVVILTDGATLSNMTMTGADAQLMEQASYSTRQIAQITGVHPHYLFDDKDGKYNANGEQAGIDVWKYTFRPWMELIDDELTRKLLSSADRKGGFSVRMDAGVITRGDSATVTNTTVAQVAAGLLTGNEGRERLEEPPLDDPAMDKTAVLGATGKGPPGAVVPAVPDVTRASVASGAVKDVPAFAATLPAGQWEALDAMLELQGQYEAFSCNVHQGGAVGKTDAAKYFCTGSTVYCDTALGHHEFSVGEHAPHAHPNLVVPAMNQTDGSQLPGNPNPVHLGHIARAAAGSRVMGAEPKIVVKPPSPQKEAAYAAIRPVIEAICDRIDAKTTKAFAAKSHLSGQRLAEWADKFSAKQAIYVRSEFAPVSASIAALGEPPIDVEWFANLYASNIVARASGGSSTTLKENILAFLTEK